MDFWWALGTGLLILFTLTDWWSTVRCVKLVGSWEVELNPAIRRWRGKGFVLHGLIALGLIVTAFFYAFLIYALFFLAGARFALSAANAVAYDELKKWKGRRESAEEAA